MKNFLEKVPLWVITVVLLISVLGTSWLLTCGMVKLITLCFGLPFTWAGATGIWLLLYLIGGAVALEH